jgi:uncharacterized protein YehS (DUF1456 family)
MLGKYLRTARGELLILLRKNGHRNFSSCN